MNREIKFRGKRIDNGEWVYGNLIYSSDACKEYETLIIPQKDADGFTTDYASNGENKESYGFDNWFCVIPETVGQYTGFEDKNGKEIYEGDVIKAESRLWQVDFKDGCFVGVDFKNVAWDELVNIGYGETEVIGNVFEDSELLEV